MRVLLPSQGPFGGVVAELRVERLATSSAVKTGISCALILWLGGLSPSSSNCISERRLLCMPRIFFEVVEVSEDILLVLELREGQS